MPIWEVMWLQSVNTDDGGGHPAREREFVINNLLVRILVIVLY
jgi:hypothetical protein